MDTITAEKRDLKQLDGKQAKQLKNHKNLPDTTREASAEKPYREVYKRPNYLLRLL